MIKKPRHVFGRDREWAALASFAEHDARSATMGIVSGRRRQGKTYLVNALCERIDGFYFAATEATRDESLRQFGAALGGFIGAGADLRFEDWSAALNRLFALGADRPLAAVIDEFPYLSRASPDLPSLLQRELDPPAQSRRGGRLRLLLCGSALSVMGHLLSGDAPLRGRASLELMVRPLPYREAAAFWGIDDPRLAVLVHSVVGGTPAYRRQFVRDDAPADLADFDDWVVRTVLEPTTPLFREARYLLAEEPDIRDPAIYHSVLAAVAAGNATWGGIANYVGRKTPHIAHPIAVLEDAALLVRSSDVFRSGRSRYEITEPLITFYESIMRESWTRLELGLGRTVWQESRQRFLSQVVGPEFERICRAWALTAPARTFGEPAAEIGAGVVVDPSNRTQIEVDVAVFGRTDPGHPRRILSLGEAKWGAEMGLRHLDRLRRARDLLAGSGYDTRDARLALYGGGGFEAELRAAAKRGAAVLVGLDDLYAG